MTSSGMAFMSISCKPPHELVLVWKSNWYRINSPLDVFPRAWKQMNFVLLSLPLYLTSARWNFPHNEVCIPLPLLDSWRDESWSREAHSSRRQSFVWRRLTEISREDRTYSESWGESGTAQKGYWQGRQPLEVCDYQLLKHANKFSWIETK